MPMGSAPGEHRGGRRKGTPNKATVAGLASAHAYMEQCDSDDDRWFEGDGLELSQRIYRDKWLPWTLRMDAVKVAIKYERPALQSITVSGDENRPLWLLTDVDNRVSITERMQLVLAQFGAACAAAMVSQVSPQSITDTATINSASSNDLEVPTSTE